MTRDKLYTTKKWRDLRARILARDNHECQIRIPNVCTSWATEVDHIEPRALNPDRALDPTNLRAACKACNHHLGGKLGASRAPRASQRHRLAASDGFGQW